MRGKKIPKQTLKLDVVVEAVRYGSRKKKLLLARGYQRRGPIWGDRVLFERKTLIELVEAKKTVVTGRPAELEGDFEVFARIQLAGSNGSLVVKGSSEEGDDLKLPLF